MDKKIITLKIIILILICINLFLIYSLCSKGDLSQKNSNDIPNYNFLGNYVDTACHRTLPTDGIYTHHLIPDEVKKHGVIPDVETAAKIAFILLPIIYDDDCLRKESPFQIELINNEIWRKKQVE